MPRGLLPSKPNVLAKAPWKPGKRVCFQPNLYIVPIKEKPKNDIFLPKLFPQRQWLQENVPEETLFFLCSSVPWTFIPHPRLSEDETAVNKYAQAHQANPHVRVHDLAAFASQFLPSFYRQFLSLHSDSIYSPNLEL